MEKLRIIRLYKVKDVPDHIIQLVEDCGKEICNFIEELEKKYDPSIILSSFNWAHAALIKNLVKNDSSSIRNATTTEVIGLMKNINFLFDGKIFPEFSEDEE